MLPILWRAEAQADLAAILEYIAERNPQSALDLYNDIERVVSQLPQHPYLYRVNAIKAEKNSQRWLARLVGAVSVFFSVFSILLSVAMPGVGWVIAAINLVLASLLTPIIGRRMLGACLALTVIHLFSFGPLSDPRALHGSPVYFAMIFVLAPMVAAMAAIVLPTWRARKR